ncbi:MAG: hypothetical protein JXA94_07115 [Parachlamydiales bacterium]|nr:hypothetical protein [Parachlamydiales bacterium]
MTVTAVSRALRYIETTMGREITKKIFDIPLDKLRIINLMLRSDTTSTDEVEQRRLLLIETLSKKHSFNKILIKKSPYDINLEKLTFLKKQ